LKAQAATFLLECQNIFPKGRSCIDPLFSITFIIERRREFNLENQLAFHNYVKVFDIVKRDTLFEILQNKNIPDILLKKYSRNLLWKQNKRKINNQLSEEHKLITESYKAALYHPTIITFTS
jgi:hypothetical protein